MIAMIRAFCFGTVACARVAAAALASVRIVSAAAAATPAPVAKPADTALEAIIVDYDAYRDTLDPVTAGQRGDRAASILWPDDSPVAVARHFATLQALQERLRAVVRAPLTGEPALNDDLLSWQIALDLEGHRFDEERIPFTADEGFFQTPNYAAEGTIIRDEADAQAWLARLRRLPAYDEIEIANMQRGIRTGFMQPHLIAVKIALATAAQAALPVEQSPLLKPFQTLPASLPADRQQALRQAALDIVRAKIKPMEQKVADFFKNSYLPAGRAKLGASSLPDGCAYYAYRVRHETTTDMTPDQVFALGQSEIARIRKAMDAEIAQTGFKGDFKAFQEHLRTDPEFYVTSREALLEKASWLAKRVDDQLPRFIGKLPRLTYGVRPVPVPVAIEETYTTGRYDPGSPEQGIAGGLMINTSHLDQRSLLELPTLVAHEGVPGHHIQISLAQEMTNLPTFRRSSEITAYVEGWALYSEQLVAEMGLYDTPYIRFGMLSMEMWRACRLVMDVGIHWKGWTRDQAIACLRDNTALADKNMQNETDRYIAWPAQALGYKIGELRIMALRHHAEAALGDRFDIRRFHDVVLDEGAMPLSLLEQRVTDWISTEQKKALVQTSDVSKVIVLQNADIRTQAPHSRLKAQRSLGHPDAPARTVPCGCDASARCR